MNRLVIPMFVMVFALGACEREKREFRGQPSAPPKTAVALSDVKPGGAVQAKPEWKNPAEENAYAVSEGKRLFRWYNCNGCHASGGGSYGPALMDDKWIYGSEPENIYQTIVQGRPNGMPSFGSRIPENQVWQLAAYVRSMSGQLRKDVAPSRSDSISAGEPESARDKESPKSSSVPPASTK